MGIFSSNTEADRVRDARNAQRDQEAARHFTATGNTKLAEQARRIAERRQARADGGGKSGQ